MSERKYGVVDQRNEQGQEVYVASMEKSAETKIKEISPWIVPGVIGDFGAGAGPITDWLSKKYPGSKIVAVDNSEEMVERMERRFYGRDNIKVVLGDIADFSWKEKFTTRIRISSNHELFSGNGYDHTVVLDALINDYKGTANGGHEIIRDGVQPEPETLYLRPLTGFACDRFSKFVKGFSVVRNVNFMVGNFKDDTFIQTGRRWFKPEDVGKSLIEISSQNASEMFSKYFYPDINLEVELKEQFGIWTLKEYKSILKSVGFSVIHAETFLLDFLLKEYYSKDFEVFHLKDGVLSNAPYPPSTMLLVGQK